MPSLGQVRLFPFSGSARNHTSQRGGKFHLGHDARERGIIALAPLTCGRRLTDRHEPEGILQCENPAAARRHDFAHPMTAHGGSLDAVTHQQIRQRILKGKEQGAGNPRRFAFDGETRRHRRRALAPRNRRSRNALKRRQALFDHGPEHRLGGPQFAGQGCRALRVG